MVLAGAGTGKTTVVVERVRHLLATEPTLQPENILVLTYNVRAAAELTTRLEQALGIETAGRLWVHNFHSFGYRLLRDHGNDIGLASNAGILDQVGQRLLLRELRPLLRDFVYHNVAANPQAVDHFADVISRAKDELVTPSEYRKYAEARRTKFQFEFGMDAFEEAIADLRNRQLEQSMRGVHEARAEGERGANRAARRDAAGINYAVSWTQLDREQQELANGLTQTYLRDAAAFEVLRLQEEATVYELYQRELEARGLLDFGEQLARTIRLLIERPNILLRYQSQFRHVLVDEFQDANMTQIQLLELVGRGPDKPDNVVVVGDDDQSIYRFRGASYAAFERFRERFERPPAWAPERPAQVVKRLPLLENRRSTANILAAAGRLIEHNQLRLKASTPLEPTKPAGIPVELVFAADEADEADQVVTRIRDAWDSLPEPRHWSDIAVPYRRHRHRERIIDRLQRGGIPYAVVGATGLFAQPDIRDVEAALRVLAHPSDSVSFTRLMTAGPWRFDAAEILTLRKIAHWDNRPMFDAASDLRRDPAQGDDALDPSFTVKLERLLGSLDDLIPRAMRDGPYTLLEEWLVRINLLHDLIAVSTPESQRQVLAIARLMRFASDWQREHTRGSLADFVAYLDLYQEVGGDLDLDVPASAAVEGVQLMTVYQAKGLEYEVVVVPRLVEGQFPDTRAETQLIPKELLKQEPPPNFEVDEERRLLFVAMTRARSRLILTTSAGPTGKPSRFLEEIEHGASDHVTVWRRETTVDAEVEQSAPSVEETAQATTEVLQRLMPVPQAFERRYELRRRAVELIGALEAVPIDDELGRERLLDELITVARQAAGEASEARAAGVDPATLRVVSRHAPAGQLLIQMTPLEKAFSYSSLSTYEKCPLQYAFSRVYRIPGDETKGFFEFGHAVHHAFEQFAIARRDAAAAGEAAPGFDVLKARFDEVWVPRHYDDEQVARSFRERAEPALRRFYDRELTRPSTIVALEQFFEFTLDAGVGEEPIRIRGVIDRIDRHPDGTIEVIDYKTGRWKTQADVDRDEQLSIYGLALLRGSVLDPVTGDVLPPASKLTLYFTESDKYVSTTRTEADPVRYAQNLVIVARRIRSGDFAATPGFKTCEWCNYRRVCPSRWGEA